MILADLTIKGRRRKVLVHFDKNGFAYTIDRATGEVLVAEPYVFVNWAKRVDLTTGRPEVDPAKRTGASRGTVKDICPTLEGGKNQQPAAYSPRTGLFYVPTNNLCMDYAAVRATYLVGTPFIGASTPYKTGPGGSLGAFIAWDAARGRKVWEIREKYPVWSGALATGGGGVVFGTLDGGVQGGDARRGGPPSKKKGGAGAGGDPIPLPGPGHR